MEFKGFLVRFLKNRKVTATQAIELESHMLHHDESLLFVIYNCGYKRGFLNDFAKQLKPCCKEILYGDRFNKSMDKKRKRDDSYDGRITKTNKNIAEIGKKIIALGSRLIRPFIKIKIDGLLPFELVMKFDKDGFNMKSELVQIVEFIRDLKDEDFETPDAWRELELIVSQNKLSCEYPFSTMVWSSIESLLTQWRLTKNFSSFNFGIQLIVFSLEEEDLNCTTLSGDTGANLKNALLFPKTSEILKHQLVSDDIYLICI